jgi:hypothetical protein
MGACPGHAYRDVGKPVYLEGLAVPYGEFADGVCFRAGCFGREQMHGWPGVGLTWGHEWPAPRFASADNGALQLIDTPRGLFFRAPFRRSGPLVTLAADMRRRPIGASVYTFRMDYSSEGRGECIEAGLGHIALSPHPRYRTATWWSASPPPLASRAGTLCHYLAQWRNIGAARLASSA